MKETFIQHKFSEESQRLIIIINDILREYQAQNFRLSLRQLYYQLVARDYIPNSQRSYKNTGNLVSKARLAGLIDWTMIEDRNRETVSVSHWENPGQIVRTAAQAFRIDKWANQDYHIEVMVEKDALSGVLEPVCRELDIAITANKGYSSSSTMYEIGKRLDDKIYYNQKSVLILYLGDHDPSGIDMTRDVSERLWLFSGRDTQTVEIKRLALNYDQVNLWNPPENPAKETDVRFRAYQESYGMSSWELDAVEPVQLAELVRNEVLSRRDEDLWLAALEQEDTMRDELKRFADEYK
jgi:hypothetical protein